MEESSYRNINNTQRKVEEGQKTRGDEKRREGEVIVVIDLLTS